MSVEVLAVVPARGGSKSIPRKNVRPLAGEPLIAYTIAAALKSSSVSRTVVTTEDEQIARVARECGADVPFLRPQELAEDEVSDLPVFRHCLAWLAEHESYEPQLVVHLRPTSPLRRAEHIDAAVMLLLATPEADCVRTVTPAPAHPMKMWHLREGRLKPFIDGTPEIGAEAYNMPRQKLPAAFIQNGSVDVIRTSVITKQESMTGRVIAGMLMDEEDSVNIDGPLDWELAEILMRRRKAEAL